MKKFKTTKGNSDLELKHSIEIFEIVFVDNFSRSAKNMILTVAPSGNYFVNPKQLVSWERNYTILDGSKSEKIQVDMKEEILVETSLGEFKLTNNGIVDVKISSLVS